MTEYCPGSFQLASSLLCPECRRCPRKRKDGTWGLHSAKRALKAPSELEQSLLTQLRWARLAAPEREWRFHPVRLWRFDLAWPEAMLAVEVQGGGWVAGKHGRGGGMNDDYDKLNTAIEMGWIVLQYTYKRVDDGRALDQIQRLLLSLCGECGRVLPGKSPIGGDAMTGGPYAVQP